jgi:HSP20 family protein
MRLANLLFPYRLTRTNAGLLPARQQNKVPFQMTREMKKGKTHMLPMIRTNVPFSPLATTALSGLESIFDRFLGDDGDFFRPSRDWNVLLMSMWQDDNNIYVEVELPGVAQDDVEITVQNGVLTIKAQRREPEGRVYSYNGRSFGRFERSVVLPVSVDSDHVEASLNSGILQLTLPKHQSARAKKITLKSS